MHLHNEGLHFIDLFGSNIVGPHWMLARTKGVGNFILSSILFSVLYAAEMRYQSFLDLSNSGVLLFRLGIYGNDSVRSQNYFTKFSDSQAGRHLVIEFLEVHKLFRNLGNTDRWVGERAKAKVKGDKDRGISYRFCFSKELDVLSQKSKPRY